MLPPIVLLLSFLIAPQEKNAAAKNAVSAETQAKVKQNLIKAEQAAMKIENKDEQIYLLAQIGWLYAKAQLRDDAKRLLKQAEELSKAEGLSRKLTSVRLTPIIRGHLVLDDVASALKVLDLIPKDKVPPANDKALAESLAAERFSQNSLVEELVLHKKLAEADKWCSTFLDPSQSASLKWHLKPIGMLAYAYYKEGRQKDAERLLKSVSGKTTTGALFFRDIFAAQAYWKALKGQKAQSKMLLDIARYWQESYEKLESNKGIKPFHRNKWAMLQARAGDAASAKSTLATITTELRPVLLDETQTLPVFQLATQELIGLTEPEDILEFLKALFGKEHPSEVELVLELRMIALRYEERHDDKSARLFWKAAHAAMKNEEEHALITRGLIFARLHEIEQNTTYKRKSESAFNQARKFYEDEKNNHTLGKTIIHPLKLCWRMQEAKDFASSFAMIKATLPAAINEKRYDRDDDKTGLQIANGGFVLGIVRDQLHANPQDYQQMVEVADSMKDKTLQAEAYCGIAMGLLPRHFRDSKDSFDDAFDY